MAGRSQPHQIMANAHGSPVAVNLLMVTHIARRGAAEAEIFFVGGASVAVKGTVEEVSEIIFGKAP